MITSSTATSYAAGQAAQKSLDQDTRRHFPITSTVPFSYRVHVGVAWLLAILVGSLSVGVRRLLERTE